MDRDRFGALGIMEESQHLSAWNLDFACLPRVVFHSTGSLSTCHCSETAFDTKVRAFAESRVIAQDISLLCGHFWTNEKKMNDASCAEISWMDSVIQ
jgi:hypothetical protein